MSETNNMAKRMPFKKKTRHRKRAKERAKCICLNNKFHGPALCRLISPSHLPFLRPPANH